MVAPDKIADLIRQLAETKHSCEELKREVDEHDTPLAALHSLELASCCASLEGVFERVHRLAKPLSELS